MCRDHLASLTNDSRRPRCAVGRKINSEQTDRRTDQQVDNTPDDDDDDDDELKAIISDSSLQFRSARHQSGDIRAVRFAIPTDS